MKKLFLALIFVGLINVPSLLAQLDVKYQTPPKDLARIVDAEPNPSTSYNSDAGVLLILNRPGSPSIEDFSAEMLRIAGTRIDPKTNGPSRPRYSTSIKVLKLNDQSITEIKGLPIPTKITGIDWANDGSGFVFTQIRNDGLDLWYVNLQDLKPVKLLSNLNGLLGGSVTWLPDNKTLICKQILNNRGPFPKASSVPTGPVVRQNLGVEAAVRTYQDLLTNKYDEQVFEYLASGQLLKVNIDGTVKDFGPSGIIRSVSPSPDGNYVMINRIKKPFSYLVPYYSFPYDVEMWTIDGAKVKTIYECPLMESIPTGSGSAQPGPRSFSWRSDVPATLVWVEALDEGDPKKELAFRDQVYILKAPFSTNPEPLIKTKLRFRGITWGSGNIALVNESWQSTRQSITSFFSPDAADKSLRTLWDRSSEDRYGNPGNFVTTSNEYGKRSLLFGPKNKTMYLTGSGASPEGNRPFVDEYDISTGKTKRLWQSEAPYYETVVELMDPKKQIILTSRQSQTEPPNYFIRDIKKSKLTQLTFFENPYKFMEGVKKEMIIYQRGDGVQLNATLYTPAGWTKEDGPLPTLLWAYPREFKSKDAAGQISGSPYTFARVSATSAIPFVTQGYAIIDGAAFPIIGEGDEEPNDHFVEQLVMNGKAAIEAAAKMGVTDPKRVGVGGHSYGAFMTANLLAHCDLFAAGIARSGAYNRTLTPFGFQSEPRTFWEAPEIYFAMSPFMHADQVNEPLLMIHGIADNNSGTFPIQSERFYSALKGHGATVRLVMLPLESHGYAAAESLKHMLWEQNNWLEKYVKNK